MSGIDFERIRQQVPLSSVLDLIGFTPLTKRGPQWRGKCPIHKSESRHSRSFSAHVEKNCWHCFGCGKSGNALDLYMLVSDQPIYEAALELCERLVVAPPRKDNQVRFMREKRR